MTTPSTSPTSDVAPTQAPLIHLADREHPFELQQHYCDNPACHCDEAVLTLTETKTDAEPLSVGLRLNLTTWQETQPPPRSITADQLVQSFLDVLSPALKAEFQSNYRHAKAIVHRLDNYRLEPQEVVAGTLVSYLDVVTEQGGVSSGGNHFTFRLELQDQAYLIEDLYCPNPACHCKEVHVLFMRHCVDDTQERVHLEDQLLARVPLRGRAKIENISHGTPQQAKALLAAWQRHYPQAQALFKARYEDIKAVGERSLSSHRPAGRLTKGQGKIGRNEPCPCGSGKKYKKCCG